MMVSVFMCSLTRWGCNGGEDTESDSFEVWRPRRRTGKVLKRSAVLKLPSVPQTVASHCGWCPNLIDESSDDRSSDGWPYDCN